MAYKDPNDERARISRRKHYHNNKEQYLKRNKEKKNKMKEYIKGVKDNPCQDCKIKYPHYVMDFDHRPEEEKFKNISRMINQGSWKKLKEEMEKCDLVCSNCHRERTAKREGYNESLM